ncbi:hypothetical protein TNCV_4078291 [Trichonephila clavipes]|nr:hypothetical protein TNCV_4078291 [Trichonephila clavipes]
MSPLGAPRSPVLGLDLKMDMSSQSLKRGNVSPFARVRPQRSGKKDAFHQIPFLVNSKNKANNKDLSRKPNPVANTNDTEVSKASMHCLSTSRAFSDIFGKRSDLSDFNKKNQIIMARHLRKHQFQKRHVRKAARMQPL